MNNAKLRNVHTNGLYQLLNGLYERQAFEMAPEFAELGARGNVAE